MPNILNPLLAVDATNILGVIAVMAGLVFFGFLIFFARCYKRCPSNRVLVIYGRTGKGAATTVHGGAKFVIPVLQDYAYLNLAPIQIEVPLRGALSAENIRVNVPSVFTVAIDTRPEIMLNAAVRLLGLTTEQTRKQAEELIFGQLRQVIASMRIEEINRDRDVFLKHIQHSLEPELNKIGLQLINVNITDITDESGYIDAIGKKAASLAIQQARGDVAENERMGEVRVASAEREKSVQVANAHKDQVIGTREAERDQTVQVANLEKEESLGQQTAKFEQEAGIKEAERKKRIQVSEAEAAAITGENVAQAKVLASQAELAVKRAEAYELGETRKRQAEANVLELQNRALAKVAAAEAERAEAEQRAKLEAPAKAMKAQIVVEAEAAAERRRLEAQAEATVIYARLEAEARGQFELLSKKGEGLKRIIDACGGPQHAFQMLMLEHLDKLAETSAQAISNLRFDKVVVWDGGGTNGNATSNFVQGVSKSLPPMLQVLKDVAGVELPESLLKFTDAGAESQPAASAEAKESKLVTSDSGPTQ